MLSRDFFCEYLVASFYLSTPEPLTVNVKKGALGTLPAPAVGARKLPAPATGADPMTTGVPTLTADPRRAVGLGYLKTKFHVVEFVMTSE